MAMHIIRMMRRFIVKRNGLRDKVKDVGPISYLKSRLDFLLFQTSNQEKILVEQFTLIYKGLGKWVYFLRLLLRTTSVFQCIARCI